MPLCNKSLKQVVIIQFPPLPPLPPQKKCPNNRIDINTEPGVAKSREEGGGGGEKKAPFPDRGGAQNFLADNVSPFGKRGNKLINKNPPRI